MRREPAAAKINLALVVGEQRADGLHEVATVLQRIDLCDWIGLEPAHELGVDGFSADTLVRAALTRLAEAAGVEPRWRVRIEKRIPVAAGLGGGSADAAAALRLANATLAHPLPPGDLVEVGAGVGADVPFFLAPGPKLAEGMGERLTPVDLPQDFWVLVALPRGARKGSTAEVYRRFDRMGTDAAFDERRRALVEALAACRRPRDLAALPRNDLGEAAGTSALLAELPGGAFRADMSGAGPALYTLFHSRREAAAVARRLRRRGARAWVVAPVW